MPAKGIPEGYRRCARCTAALPLDCFRWLVHDGRWCSWCNACARAVQATEQAQQTARAYWRRPENRERRQQRDRKRQATDAYRAKRKRYRSSLCCKLVANLGQCRRRLLRATTEEARQRLRRLIAGYEAELARLRGSLEE